MSRWVRFDWVSPRGRPRRPSATRKQSALPYSRRLRVELLEDRRLLATITVNSLVDEADGSIVDGDISLRDAIAAASAGDTIDFSVTGTINLTSLGHLSIDKDLTINGPGANLLAINAYDPTPTENNGDGSRVFRIDGEGPFNLIDVALANLTLTGGDPAGSGGAVVNLENLTITACTIADNSANAGGGLVNVSPIPQMAATLTVIESTISGNLARGTSDGGAIVNDYGANLSVTRSTISGNTGRRGGGISLNSGALTVIDSTISGNTASVDGGGIFTNQPTTIAGSTISGNSAGRSGGGVFNRHGVTVIRHSTITDNEAIPGAGGGAASFGDAATRTEVAGSIISGNVGSDVAFVVYTSGTNTFQSNGFNLIGTGDGVPAFTNNDQTGVTQPGLGPLAANGGPTLTHNVLVGSPALDRGNPAAQVGVGNVPQYDQRGDPYRRIVNGDGVGGARIDIGAVERQTLPVSLVVDTLDDENDGDHTTGDFSLREAIGLANSLFDSHDTISFAAALTANGPATITLDEGDLVVTDSLTINGPGADLLTIDASGNDPTPNTNNGDGSRVFDIGNNFGDLLDIELVGLTLTGGDVSISGGAIRSTENLAVIGSIISGSWAFSIGGGIYHQTGALTVTDCTITGNEAERGGGIGITDGVLTVNDSLISNNSAVVTGGGMFIQPGPFTDRTIITIVGCTISENSSAFGGGIYNLAPRLTVADSTISGNMASVSGGGIMTEGYQNGVTKTIINTTISGNTAASRGGGVFNSFGFAAIRHSTITNNTAANGSGSGIATRGDNFSTRTEVHSSIIAGNTASDVDIVGSTVPNLFVSLGYNLIGTGNITGEFVEPGDMTGVTAPFLGPLSNNGGPTRTHALLTGSPAIDAGNPAAMEGVSGVPVFDQRGAPFFRINSGRIDIGALESQALPPAFFGDYNQDGIVDAADYVIWRKTLNTNVANYGGADGDGDGVIDQDDYDVWLAHFGETSQPAAASGTGAATALAAPVPPNSQIVLVERLAQVESASDKEISASLHASEPNQDLKPRGANAELLARVPFGWLSASYRPAMRPSFGADPALAANRRDVALVAWLASQPDRKPKLEEFEEADVSRDEDTSNMDYSHLDCIDQVFALLTSGEGDRRDTSPRR